MSNIRSIKLLLILLGSQEVFAFLSLPFNGFNFLDSILSALNSDYEFIGDDLMKNAIPGEECYRTCEKNDQRVCHFKFNLEFYHVLGGACGNCTRGNPSDCFHPQCVTADGVERGILTVNRELPGTAIEVCLKDIVVVDVSNEMDGSSATIHWHGMTQKGTPYSDGVPFITQCPIHFGNSFRYTFEAIDAGTNFYHGHCGLQKVNGLYGAIIVRLPKDSNLYDYDLRDFKLVVSDWMHTYAESFFPTLPTRALLYQSVLINGRGSFLDNTTYENAPLEVFTVKQHSRYRFRLINAASSVCSFLLKIENHNITIIAADGSSMEPTEVETLHFISGERYDFVVNADQEPRDYAIQVKGYSLCARFEGYAVLRYSKGSKESQSTSLDFMDMKKLAQPSPEINEHTFNIPYLDLKGIPGADGQSIATDASILESKADHEFNIFFGTPQVNATNLFDRENNIKFMSFKTPDSSDILNNIGAVNNISLIMPHFNLLSEPEKITEEMFCDIDDKLQRTCIPNTQFCHCIHRLKVKLNSIVELVVIDIQDVLTHPFHLHGHKFYVMEMGTLNETVTANQIKNHGVPPGKLNKRPLHRDTTLIPSPGFVRVRFRADNPGFWLAHCHFEWHLAIGMGFLLQVGELDQMVKTPQGFAKCNSYMPNRL